LSTCNDNFLTFSFFTLSTSGAGIAAEVLGVAGLLAEAEVCFGEALAASPATFNDGTTTTEGTVSFIVVLLPTVSFSIPCFDRFGSEASTLEKKKNEESIQKPAQEEIKKGSSNGLETLTSMVHHHRPR
jgi:hypothetical protein